MEPEIVCVPSAYKHGVTEEDIRHACKTMNNYTDMTDEEYAALDEEMTRSPPRIISNGSDWISQREMRLLGMTNLSVNYLITKSAADHKTVPEIIDELVRKELAAAVTA